MKKTTLYLFMLMASFSWQSLSAQISDAKFGFQFGDGDIIAISNYDPIPLFPSSQIDGSRIEDEPAGIDINGNTTDEDFTAVFAVDLSGHDKWEGDIIYIFNQSVGVDDAIWDINWHDNTVPLSGGQCPYIGTHIETDDFDQSDTYGLQLTIPIYGGVSNSDGTITHDLWLAPGNLAPNSCASNWWVAPPAWQRWHGLHEVCTTYRGIKIEITVNEFPECFESQTICPGVILDMDSINPNGYTASNWSPYNPTIEGVYETTTFSVDLENAYENSTNCSFQVEVNNPVFDLINIDMLCAEDLPYSFNASGVWNTDNTLIDISITRTSNNNSVTDIAYNKSAPDYVAYIDYVYFDEESLTFNLPGFYEITYTYGTVTDGIEIICTKTYELTIHKEPKIIIRQEISFCGQNFETICIPNPPLNYNFSWENPFGAVYQSSSNPCFTPTQYGHYVLVVSNKFGCEYEYSFNVVEGLGPKIVLNDVEFCKELENAPTYLGFNYSLLNAVSYSWTHNGNPIAGQNSSQIPFTLLYDGTYCVTVTWDNDCESKACFEVYECCGEPDPAFTMSYQSTTISNLGALTVQNDPNNTIAYSSEQFVLYQWCKGFGWIEVITSSILFTDFDTPYIFTYPFNFQCKYKVVHRVWSDCYNKSFIYEQVYEPYQPMPIIVYPNPTLKGMPVNIKMTSYVDPAYVEITNLVTGERVFTGKLEFSNLLSIDYSVFTKSKGSSFGIYNVKVFNKTSVVNEKLIMR